MTSPNVSPNGSNGALGVESASLTESRTTSPSSTSSSPGAAVAATPPFAIIHGSLYLFGSPSPPESKTWDETLPVLVEGSDPATEDVWRLGSNLAIMEKHAQHKPTNASDFLARVCGAVDVVLQNCTNAVKQSGAVPGELIEQITGEPFDDVELPEFSGGVEYVLRGSRTNSTSLPNSDTDYLLVIRGNDPLSRIKCEPTKSKDEAGRSKVFCTWTVNSQKSNRVKAEQVRCLSQLVHGVIVDELKSVGGTLVGEKERKDMDKAVYTIRLASDGDATIDVLVVMRAYNGEYVSLVPNSSNGQLWVEPGTSQTDLSSVRGLTALIRLTKLLMRRASADTDDSRPGLSSCLLAAAAGKLVKNLQASHDDRNGNDRLLGEAPVKRLVGWVLQVLWRAIQDHVELPWAGYPDMISKCSLGPPAAPAADAAESNAAPSTPSVFEEQRLKWRAEVMDWLKATQKNLKEMESDETLLQHLRAKMLETFSADDLTDAWNIKVLEPGRLIEPDVSTDRAVAPLVQDSSSDEAAARVRVSIELQGPSLVDVRSLSLKVRVLQMRLPVTCLVLQVMTAPEDFNWTRTQCSPCSITLSTTESRNDLTRAIGSIETRLKERAAATESGGMGAEEEPGRPMSLKHAYTDTLKLVNGINVTHTREANASRLQCIIHCK